MSTEEQDKAIIAAEMAVNNDTTNFQNHIELGMAYFYADRFDEAISAFRQALVLNPNASAAYNGMGRVYYHTGPAQAAIEAYQHAINQDPHYVDAYYGLGILYSSQLGDYKAAVKTFQDGITHNPAEAFLVASLGSTYARMRQFEQAIESLQQSLNIEPDNAFAHSWLSIIYLHLGKYDDAITACQHEIEIEDSHSARRVMGYLYHCMGRYDESIAQLQQAITHEPQDYEARGALTRVYRRLRRESDADEQYAIASEIASQDDEYGQACLEAVSGNVERAINLLKTALDKEQVQPDWVRIDPEFVFVLEDPGIKALLRD